MGLLFGPDAGDVRDMLDPSTERLQAVLQLREFHSGVICWILPRRKAAATRSAIQSSHGHLGTAWNFNPLAFLAFCAITIFDPTPVLF